MSRNWRRVIGAGIAILGLSACSAERTTAPAAESQVIVRAQALGSTAGLVVEVSGPGIDPALLFNIPVGSNDVASDTLSIPAGGGRRFVVTAVDTFGVATHRADTTVTLTAGVQAALALVLRPLSSTVGITITIANTPPASTLLILEGTDDGGRWRRIGVSLLSDSTAIIPGDTLSLPTAVAGKTYSMYGNLLPGNGTLLAGASCFPCAEIVRLKMTAPTSVVSVMQPGGHGNLEMRPSRDGAYIVWSRHETYGPGGRIWVASGDGTGAVQLTSDQGADKSPVLTPDNARIVWARRSAFEGTDLPTNIWRMQRDGTAKVQLTSSNVDELPSVSPDGTRIAFMSKRSGSWAVWVMNADGTGASEVAQTAALTPQTWNQFGDGNRARPVWSPDGRMLAFQGEQSGLLGVYIVPVNGSRAPWKVMPASVAQRIHDWR